VSQLHSHRSLTQPRWRNRVSNDIVRVRSSHIVESVRPIVAVPGSEARVLDTVPILDWSPRECVVLGFPVLN
jgi:hypothetical protein